MTEKLKACPFKEAIEALKRMHNDAYSCFGGRLKQEIDKDAADILVYLQSTRPSEAVEDKEFNIEGYLVDEIVERQKQFSQPSPQITDEKRKAALMAALDKAPFYWLTIQSNGQPKVGKIDYGENEKYYSESAIVDLIYNAIQQPDKTVEMLKGVRDALIEAMKLFPKEVFFKNAYRVHKECEKQLIALDRLIQGEG